MGIFSIVKDTHQLQKRSTVPKMALKNIIAYWSKIQSVNKSNCQFIAFAKVQIDSKESL